MGNERPFPQPRRRRSRPQHPDGTPVVRLDIYASSEAGERTGPRLVPPPPPDTTALALDDRGAALGKREHALTARESGLDRRETTVAAHESALERAASALA